jgi:hypothetical protein
MRNLLPFILLLACPVMMIFMMRGMRGGGQGSFAAGHETHPSHAEADAREGQVSEERIGQLEREVAQVRVLRGEHPEHRWAQRS